MRKNKNSRMPNKQGGIDWNDAQKSTARKAVSSSPIGGHGAPLHKSRMLNNSFDMCLFYRIHSFNLKSIIFYKIIESQVDIVFFQQGMGIDFAISQCAIQIVADRVNSD